MAAARVRQLEMDRADQGRGAVAVSRNPPVDEQIVGDFTMNFTIGRRFFVGIQ